MAGKKDALATKDPAPAPVATDLALVQNDELAALAALGDFDFGADDGLEEIGAEDIKLAAKVFNFKGVDAAGDPIPPNVFYDTVEETTKKQLSLVLLTLNKSNEWREYDEAEGRSKIRCRSFDRETGEMEDGTTRPCQGCPDAQWRTENGKRARRCGPVYNVFAVDRESRQPCVIRFKRTSLPVIQSHLNKHHIGRRVVNGRRANYPLFAFGVTASLKMSEDKKYAIPVLERGPVLAKQEIEDAAESAKYVREALLPALRKLAEKDTDESGVSTAATVTRAEDFADDAAPADGTRF